MYHIGDFEYDESTQTLTSPEKQTIEVRDQLARLLQALLDAEGELTPTKDLEIKVWGNNTVSDATVKAEITALRKLFGESGTSFVKNVRSRGYYLNAPISKVVENEDPNTNNLAPVEQSKNKSIFTKGRAAFMLAVFTMLATIAISTTNGNQPEDVSTLTPSSQVKIPKIKNLTFVEGQELSPSLSPNGDYLAFTYTKNPNVSLQVTVKELTGNKSVTFDHYFAAGPRWDSNGKYVYYTTYEDESCTIVRREHFGNLVFSEPEDIASCGTQRSVLAPAVDSRDEWIYFNYKSSTKSPFVIKRKHLVSGMEQQITLSTDSSYGDYSLALSPDSKMLAFLSSDANSVHRLRIMEMDTGNIKELRQFNKAIVNVTWDQESENVFFIDKQIVKGINVDSEQSYDVYQLPQKGRSITHIGNDSFLVSLGGFYTGNLAEWDIGTEFNMKTVHSSPFNESDTSGIPDTDNYIFISDRSGENQVWHLTENGVFQVSDFKNQELITDIDVAPSGDALLLLADGTIYTRKLSQDMPIYKAHAMSSIVKNPIWSCDSDDIIYMSVKINGTWHLAKFDLSNESVVTLAAGVTAINSDCKSSKYYVTRDGVKNIFAININNGNVFNEPLVDDVSFSDRKEWSVYNDVLYYVYDGVVYSQPFHTKEVRKLSSTKDNVTQIELNNGRLLFIVKTLDDSHISELSP